MQYIITQERYINKFYQNIPNQEQNMEAVI